LHERAAANHTGRPENLHLGLARLVIDVSHAGSNGQVVPDGGGTLVAEVDLVPRGVLPRAQMRLHQQAPCFLHVPDHPRGPVDRMELSFEQPRSHLSRDRHFVRDLITDPRSPSHVDTMPHMETVSEAELARRAGTTLEGIRRLADLGIVSAEPDDSYRLGNLQRIRLAESLERGGVPLDAVGKAIAEGRLSFSFLELVTNPAGYSPKTYEVACKELGWTMEFVQLVHGALGLPRPEPDDLVRDDDYEMFAVGQFASQLGMSDTEVYRALRLYGENLGRIGAGQAPLFHDFVESPLLRSGMSEAEMLQASSQISPQLRVMVERMMLWVYRRHQEHATIEHIVEHVENMLEEAGLAVARPARPPAMVFLDLVGYTRLTEERGDHAAAELVGTLAEVVQSESLRFGGKPVKWLGDGVMFHFPDPRQAVLCSLDLVDRTPSAGLPPAHVGVNAGPVIFRDGDYFGRTVNVAARIAGQAGPGEVLVSDDVVGLASGDGLRFDRVGPVELKGLAKPVVLHRVSKEAG
jgi:adenylate cyclase